ncbi:hypothetical protein [Saccharopolyspora sp. SCSIO 74807]|uniref:hypothetical protein n=1 Tax=Saccharopolyspora sp. SCSIO 74807 TaxID=3118084 RepID=UPI0030CFAAF9
MADQVGVDPELLSSLTSKLRNVAADVEAEASEPPIPQAGEVTDVIEAALRLICTGVGNMSASAGGVGDAVAESRDTYTTTDYESALQLEKTQLNAENPN